MSETAQKIQLVASSLEKLVAKTPAGTQHEFLGNDLRFFGLALADPVQPNAARRSTLSPRGSRSSRHRCHCRP
jgi:hypothetical protein